MHKFEKITFEPVTSPHKLPDLKLDRLECPNCRSVIPVPPEYVDWKEVADLYKATHERMMKHLWENLKEAGEQFNVPLVEYFEADRHLLISLMEEILNKSGPK